jgi:parafibromin
MNRDPLIVLQSAIAASVTPVLLTSEDPSATTPDIVVAKFVLFPPIPGISDQATVISLDTATRFQSKQPETQYIDYKTVYNCWITRDLSVTDYITVSDERGILNLKFLERTDLITWLEGASNESEYIVEQPKAAAAAPGETPKVRPAKREIDPDLQKIYAQERTLIDHNRALRGAKTIDFSHVSAECRQKIIMPFRNGANRHSNDQAGSTRIVNELSRGKNKEPIILLSPAASALLNMSNAKEFFENGIFEPRTSTSGASNIARISRNSSKLGPLRFVVVDSVERFKPEYWQRVVAVFATGQSWQFRPYQWSDPDVLFSKVLGFALVYKGDPLPPTLSQWNVSVELLDRNQRFRDKEVLERIWEKIERSMIQRGYPVKS